MKKGLWISLCILILITITSFGLAYVFNTGVGQIVVKTVLIEDPVANISGMIYIPNPDRLSSSALFESSDYAFPAVILVHGIMNAKETMSSLALEISRGGMVAITIDALGHGNSEGVTGGEDDASLGGLTALNYIQNLPFVNQSKIGLIGHSMGVGAIRAISASSENIISNIFIGGIGTDSNEVIYGELNTTSPSNLLVAIGKYDELFDIEATNAFLQPIFGTDEEIELNRIYGSFSNKTAHKFIVPNTIHLFEPISTVIIKESVSWMSTAFNLPFETKPILAPYRDLFLFIGMISLLGISFPIIKLLITIPILHNSKEEMEDKHKYQIWVGGGIWSVLHLLLFVPPIIFLGMSARIFPLSLGTTAIVWMLLLSISGIIMIYLFHRKSSIKKITNQMTYWKGLVLSIGLFLILLGLDWLLELFSLSLKMFVPLFSSFTIQRFWMFLILVPFVFGYFLIDGILVIGTYNSLKTKPQNFNKLVNMVKVVGIKILPLVLVLVIQYLPLLTFEFQILTGFLGFSMQFIIMLVPLYAIYTLIEIWFYKSTQDILPGAMLNSLLFSWTLAILLNISIPL